MARHRTYKLIDLNFNSFAHNWFIGLTLDQRRNLTSDELYKVSDDKRLRAWITNAPLEERLVMLAKTGCPLNITLGDKKKVKELAKMANNGADTQDVIDEMINNKVFVLSSAAILFDSYLLNQNSQSDFYLLNRNFHRIYELWKMAGKNFGKWRTEDDLQRIEYGFDLLLELVYRNTRNRTVFSDYGLGQEVDLTILCYLMRKNKRTDNRNSFISQNRIYQDCTDGTQRMNTYTTRLKFLERNNFIIRGKNGHYAIHDKGVMAVGEFMKRLADGIAVDL